MMPGDKTIADFFDENPSAPLIVLGRGETGIILLAANGKGAILMTKDEPRVIGALGEPGELAGEFLATICFEDSAAIDRMVGTLRQLQEGMATGGVEWLTPVVNPIPARNDGPGGVAS